jgi:hypothetical protein
MQSFERNRKVEDSLNIGIARNLPIWMEDSIYHYTDYFDVWRWAMENEKDFIFPYIVARKDLNWHGEKIVIGMEDNNTLLWESVSEMCYPAVKAILEVPDLFSEEVLTMETGVSYLKGRTYLRGDKQIPYRATNLGAFAQVAMTKGEGDWRILDALKKYYEDSIK